MKIEANVANQSNHQTYRNTLYRQIDITNHEKIRHHGEYPINRTILYILAFTITPYFAAHFLVILGLRPNEWWPTSHLGVIVAFIRRAGPPELISSIFYCYAVGATLIAIPSFNSLVKTDRELRPKIIFYIMCSLVYGILIVHSFLRGPSEGSFNPPYIRAHLGIQVASTNDITYALMCAVLTIQATLAIMFPFAIIRSSSRKSK